MLVLRRADLLVELDSRAGGEYDPRLEERDLLHVLDERERVAVRAARPAPVALPLGVDVEGGAGVVVEGAEGLEDRAEGFDGQIRRDNRDDVAGGLDLFGQLHRVGRHGAPADGRHATRTSRTGGRSPGAESEVGDGRVPAVVTISAVGRPSRSVVGFPVPRALVELGGRRCEAHDARGEESSRVCRRVGGGEDLERAAALSEPKGRCINPLMHCEL